MASVGIQFLNQQILWVFLGGKSETFFRLWKYLSILFLLSMDVAMSKVRNIDESNDYDPNHGNGNNWASQSVRSE